VQRAAGRGFLAVWIVVFPRFGVFCVPIGRLFNTHSLFACLLGWFGRMVPGLYEFVQTKRCLSLCVQRIKGEEALFHRGSSNLPHGARCGAFQRCDVYWKRLRSISFSRFVKIVAHVCPFSFSPLL
jgi:hypothetical protein